MEALEKALKPRTELERLDEAVKVFYRCDWTDEAIKIVLGWGINAVERIAEELFFVPSVSVIVGETVFEFYPGGFGSYPKNEYIERFNEAHHSGERKAIEDIREWDDYAIYLDTPNATEVTSV